MSIKQQIKMPDFEADQQDAMKKTDNIQSLADQVEQLEKFIQSIEDRENEIKELKLSKNGQVLWRKTSTLNTKINGPIQWPIKAISPNEKYLLTVRPTGSMIGEETSIIIQGKEKQSLQKLDEVIISLGKSQNNWSKRIKESGIKSESWSENFYSALS